MKAPAPYRRLGLFLFLGQPLLPLESAPVTFADKERAMKTAMKTLVAIGVMASAGTAWAQFDPLVRDAGSKMRDEAISGHEYRARERYAQQHAQTLYYYYTRPQPQITPQKAKEVAGEIRKNLSESDKLLAKIKTAHAKEPEVVKLIDSIEKHHAKAHEVCGMLEEECTKEHGDHVVCAQCCSDMWHELDAAKADTDKLFKMLKIEELPPPAKKVGTPQKAAPKKEETKK
jgi:hypothetical protein